MGYYTRYTLDHAPKSLGISPSIELAMAQLYGGSDPFEEECKWYEHEKDMREFSLKFPGILFTLHGEGEEAGDVWNKYFRDGKFQVARAVITFPKFDPKELR